MFCSCQTRLRLGSQVGPRPGRTLRIGNRNSTNAAFCRALADDSSNFTLEKDGGEEATFSELDVESAGGLGGTSENVFGPLAVLLVGFQEADFSAFQSMMLGMDADMVPIHSCDKEMMSGTLQAALEQSAPGYRTPPLGTRRAVILSGMIAAEVVDVVAEYREMPGLPPAVFAAAVPRNYDRVVSSLVAEIYEDDRRMKQPMLDHSNQD